MAAFGDREAGLAHAAGIDRRAALPVRADAVERLGDQAGGRRLADAADAGQQEGVGEPIALDRVAERLHHRILPDQLRKTLRPIFAREDAISLRFLGLRRPVQAKAEGVGVRGNQRASAHTNRSG